ncbi:hypothetical protein H5154_10615 [Pseudoalteromonas sp. SR44-5]|uniref:hypothetical protein n=1 Tax=Pseudoalteromonas TaxID=53246 RepID=UPI0012316061|nr:MULTISPECIES: hypothetical protein [Pseudoalteromonas]MBB1334326.1 hypothetical protein [Pseudoalteromonas sp. SR41-6]MBB1342066.1 hypothetical protein [Pseudoalteromonas sp. SR45-6]MBB1366830.1 hypothetical protein [Pseudoalteromonas sp. SR44-5]MBB1417629.1 hypothetical protein [Pseudoalteromonas sp. SG44-1]MBB1424399.1 hypothetical protein [Pseudoalteromonas sp. SG43-7]
MKIQLLVLLPLLVSAFVSGLVKANDEVLSVDQVALQGMQFSFENDAKVRPKNSDFSVVNSVLMSSEQGRRVAVVTIRNDASGSRILQAEHIMALFADGRRISPMALADNIKLDDGEQRTLTLSFGEDNFPILSIFTSNNLN